MSHLLHYKPITVQYPHEKRIACRTIIAGCSALLRYDDGTEKCVGCDLVRGGLPVSRDPRRQLQKFRESRPSGTPRNIIWT